MTAHRAPFADGSGLLFDDELQVLAGLREFTSPEAEPQPTVVRGGNSPVWGLCCHARSVTNLLAPLRLRPCGEAGESVLKIVTGSDGYTLSVGSRVAVCRRRDEVLPLAKTLLLAATLTEDTVALHTAALGRGGRCLLLPGAVGSGKSTLSAALLHVGFDFVADDVVRLQRGELHGLAFPLALKETGWPVLKSRYPDLSRRPAHRRPDGVRVKYLTPVGMTAPDRVGWIVFPRYVKGAAPQITKIEPSVAFGRLIAEAYSPAGRLAGDQFQAMAGWMRDAEAFDLRYGQLDDAVAAVEAITGSPRLPHRNGVDRGSQAEV